MHDCSDAAGVYAILKRFDRRVAATYRLGRDPFASTVPRMLARLLSGYERARAREVVLILLDPLPLFDGPAVWLVRHAIFLFAGRALSDHDVTLDDAIVPASGWPGDLLALGCWAAALGGVWLLAAETGVF